MHLKNSNKLERHGKMFQVNLDMYHQTLSTEKQTNKQTKTLYMSITNQYIVANTVTHVTKKMQRITKWITA